MRNLEGHIVSVRFEGAGVRALVEVGSAIACSRCEAGRGCGAGLLGRDTGKKQVEALVAEHLNVESGDAVSLALAPRNILRAAVIVYGYPLFGAVSGAGMAYAAGRGDVYGAVAALSGLVVGILLARHRLRDIRCLRDFTPAVVDRLSPVSD